MEGNDGLMEHDRIRDLSLGGVEDVETQQKEEVT